MQIIMHEPSDTVKMSLDPRHLACAGVSVINIFSFGMFLTAEGDPVETQLCHGASSG